MSIIREKIRFNNSLVGLTGGTTGFTGTTMSLNFSLSSSDNLIEYQQEIDRLTQFTTLDLVNPVTDGEERRFKMNPNPNPNITLHFYFYSVPLTTYDNDTLNLGFVAAGFTVDEMNEISLNLLNSFFILDYYDTFDINSQTKIFTTYLTKILVLPKVSLFGLNNVYIPKYTIGTSSNNQLYRWYVPISYFTGTTMTGYVKLSFFNAKTGKITTFFNNDNINLTTPEYLFFKAQLDRSNIINKVNDTVANKDNLKQNPPSGDTFVVSSNSVGYGSTTIASPIIPTAPTLGTLTMSFIVSNNAVGNSSVTSDGGSSVSERGFVWSTTPNPTTDNSVLPSGSGLGVFTGNLFPLNYATTYYVRAYAINNVDIGYSNEVSFTTPPVAPTVVTDMVGTVQYNSATLQGHIENTGGAPITASGFIYGSNPSFLTLNVNAVLATNFYASASPLAATTTYYYKAYATNSAGTSYGSVSSFSTPAPPPPTVTTISPDQITSRTARIRFGVANIGSYTIAHSGVAWDTFTNPPATGNHDDIGAITTDGVYYANMSGLQPNQLYYVRAYITTGVAQYVYGNQITVTSAPAVPPTLGVLNVDSIVSNNAVGHSSVANDGGANVYEFGFVWNTTGNPTLSDSHIIGTGTIASFTGSLFPLNYATTYYVRAYAANTAGVGYSSADFSFTTPPIPPVVVTDMAGTVTQSTGTLQGHIENTGGAAVTTVGFLYGSQGYFTINVPAILGTNFYASASPLAPSTSYNYKAYATNSAGTSYGGIVNFTTSAALPPIVTTAYALDIVYNTAIIRAGVAYTGTHTVSERGVVWSTQSGPDQSSNKQTNNSGNNIGNYDTSIGGLSSNQLYHVRAYAYTAEEGYIYGNEITFTAE
jgi:hypothetical protein